MRTLCRRGCKHIILPLGMSWCLLCLHCCLYSTNVCSRVYDIMCLSLQNKFIWCAVPIQSTCLSLYEYIFFFLSNLCCWYATPTSSSQIFRFITLAEGHFSKLLESGSVWRVFVCVCMNEICANSSFVTMLVSRNLPSTKKKKVSVIEMKRFKRWCFITIWQLWLHSCFPTCSGVRLKSSWDSVYSKQLAPCLSGVNAKHCGRLVLDCSTWGCHVLGLQCRCVS